MNAAPRDRDLLLQIVRLERPWTDARLVGVTVTRESTGFRADFARDTAVVVGLDELARGLREYQANPRELRGWAFTVLAMANFEPQEHPAFDVLMDALHDASFGQPLSDEARAAIEQLTGSEQGGRTDALEHRARSG